jgi:hypothetical protein
MYAYVTYVTCVTCVSDIYSYVLRIPYREEIDLHFYIFLHTHTVLTWHRCVFCPVDARQVVFDNECDVLLVLHLVDVKLTKAVADCAREVLFAAVRGCVCVYVYVCE